MGNSIGELFRITSFGESHGRCVGVIVDGCPAGLALQEEDIQKEVDKRKPGFAGTTNRLERDRVEIYSGVLNGYTTGAPICLMLKNENINSSDYENNRMKPRPGHADYTAFMKYGGFNDYKGGGRFSGRITAGFVMAGAIAKLILNTINVEILAHTIQIGELIAKKQGIDAIRNNVDKNHIRCADLDSARKMVALIEEVQNVGDSIGGVIEGIAVNLPVGLGEPVFDTLEGDLSKAIFAIPAVKGVEFGSGMVSATRKGSENNDCFRIENKRVVTRTNNSGGILGGMSNGMPLELRVAIKPTASISQKQQTVDMDSLEEVELSIKGRHDSCIVPRAVVVVEAMMAIVLCDFAIRAGLLRRILK